MDLGLRGRRALVTGGTSGIGAAAARCLAEEGAAVAIAARRRPFAESVAEAMSSELSAQVHPLTMDVTDLDSIDAGVAEATARLGGLDVIVHAAGGSTMTDWYRARTGDRLPLQVHEDRSWTFRHRLHDSTDADWLHLYKLNAVSFVHLARVARPELRKSGHGRLIAVASVSGRERGGGQWDYHVAKAAEIAAAHCLAAEMMEDRILVNVVCPGATDSDASLGLREILAERTGQSVAEVTERAWANLPFHRAATAEEVGATICFLASARASYINGATIVVDGGASLGLL